MVGGTSLALMSTDVSAVTWLGTPEDHDFPAAVSYLSLLFSPDQVQDIVARLKAVKTARFKVKDLLRASRLPLLDKDDWHVKHDLDKIAHHEALSPVLVVRGDGLRGLPLVIADGYHRVCASYHTDENTDVPCRIVATARD